MEGGDAQSQLWLNSFKLFWGAFIRVGVGLVWCRNALGHAKNSVRGESVELGRARRRCLFLLHSVGWRTETGCEEKPVPGGFP